MRTGAGFEAAPPVVVSGGGQHSAWHSPVPYLFGGLAAMLGLIAFALLVLACSYWKLSGYLDGSNGGEAESGGEADEKPAVAASKGRPLYEEGIVVIMAGDKKPTFLATPICSRASSFGDQNANNNDNHSSNIKMDCLYEEKQRDVGLDDDVRVSIQTQNQEL